MRILLLIEDREESPTTKIAKSIAKELSNENDVFACYLYNFGNSCREYGDYYVEYFKSEYLCGKVNKFYQKYKWQKLDRFNKAKALLLNPLQIIYRCLIKSRFNIISRARLIDKYCKNHAIDAVLAFTEPYDFAEVLEMIKNTRYKGLVQLDPYSTNYTSSQEKREKAYKKEKKILTEVDNVFTTQLIINDYREYHLLSEDQMNKAVEIEFPMIINSRTENKNECINQNIIKFLHAGSFYDDIRNPQILVDLFEKLPDNYVLLVAGINTEMIMELSSNLKGRIINKGSLSLDEVRKLQDEVDFIISFNNKIPNMIPSKLLETINTGKPFINLCQISNCPTLRYVDDYDNAFTIFSYEIEKKVDDLVDFVNRKRGSIVDWECIERKYKTCTPAYVANIIYNSTKKKFS